MVEAVSRHGYVGTTLNELVSLAGVSKSTFYDHFDSKQDCFLATFDEIVAVLGARVGEAYRSGDDFRERLGAGLATFMDTAVEEPAAAMLTAVEVLTLGAPGVEHTERASRSFEQLVQQSFDHSAAEVKVSPPIVRAIVAGVKGVVYRRVRAGRSEELPGVVDELVDWAMSYQREPSETARRAITASELPRPKRAEDSAAKEHRPGWDEPPDSRRSKAGLNQRERIVRAAARVAVERGYETLSIPTITSTAGVSNQTFYEHFASKREAFMAAFEEFGSEGLRRTGAAFAAEGDRPEAIGVGLREMLEHFAENELLAKLVFLELPAAGPVALDRADQMLDQFAAFLRPEAAPSALARPLPTSVLEAIPSGGYAVIQHELVNGRLASLPELAPELTWLALAPFDGPA
jgi:AcrR family transcriptional regulator